MSWRDRNMEEVKVEPSDPFMGKDKERKNKINKERTQNMTRDI